MDIIEKEIIVKDSSSNPEPLGLVGFGVATVLMNIHNAGFIDMNAMILATGVFFGGGAQLLAGAMEWKKGNTFATTAFISYGLFWLTFIGIKVFPVLGLATIPGAASMGFFHLVFGVLTLIFIAAASKLTHTLQLVLALVVMLFFLLAMGDFTGDRTFTTAAGYTGIICGSVALYIAFAQVMNEVYKKNIFPLWPITKKN